MIVAIHLHVPKFDCNNDHRWSQQEWVKSHTSINALSYKENIAFQNTSPVTTASTSVSMACCWHSKCKRNKSENRTILTIEELRHLLLWYLRIWCYEAIQLGQLARSLRGPVIPSVVIFWKGAKPDCWYSRLLRICANLSPSGESIRRDEPLPSDLSALTSSIHEPDGNELSLTKGIASNILYLTLFM